MQFRKDINGLRAWAVVAVVLFHFGIPGFEGGFVGVDIFFVISGFLMTGIIVGGLSAASAEKAGTPSVPAFSLGRFYLARARRIMPALMALCVALLICGWFLLGPYDYEMLASHGIRALVFISNIRFWQEAGYFDAASHEKWFLHTWSLSVEWQFYLLFPLILLAIWKIRPDRKLLGQTILALFVISLVLSIVFSPVDPTASFYLLHTRAWELLAGGLVYCYANAWQRSPGFNRALEAVGFALIIASILLLDSNVVWPGYWALLPVTGTALVLVAARQSSWLTAKAPFQWLGKTSYSIYLWHWPLCVFLVYFELQKQWLPVLSGLAATLVLGWLSWAYVEQLASKNLAALRPKPQAIAIFSLVVLIALPFQLIKDNDGITGRLSPQINAVFAEADNKNPMRRKCYKESKTHDSACTYGGETLGVIVIGDSHAQSVVRSVEKALPSENLHVLDWSSSSCITVANVKEVRKRSFDCGAFVANAVVRAQTLPGNAPILIVNRISSALEGPNEEGPSKPTHYLSSPHSTRTDNYYAEMERGIIDTACAFAAYRPVYMLRPIPELKLDVPRTMGRALIRGEERRVSISLEEYEERHKRVWEIQNRAAEQCGVKLLDPRPHLCNNGRCWGDLDGLPIYFDDDHLNERGSQLLIPLFRQMFTHS